jgi:hypothetical protein
MTSDTLTPTADLAFPFIRTNERPPKLRARGPLRRRGR